MGGTPPGGGVGRLSVASALEAVLEAHPDAVVLSVSGDGLPGVIALPPGFVGLDDVTGSDPDAVMDLVHPDDRLTIARLWGRSRVEGVAAGTIRLRADPGRPSMLYFFDLRQERGSLIAVFTEGDASCHHAVDAAVRAADLAPRLFRAHRDASAVYTAVDPAVSRVLGWDPAEIIGHRTLEFVHPDDQEAGIAGWMELLELPGGSRTIRLRHRHRNGSWVWLEVTNTNRLADPDHGDILGEMVDISEEMAALDALRAREQLLGQLTETVPVGLFHVDLAGNLLFANGRLHTMTGAPADAPLARHLADVVPEDRGKLDEAFRRASTGADNDVEIRILPAGRSIKHCTVSIRPLRSAAGVVIGLTGCVEDVTVAVRNREELEARATSDPLTQCLNRGATLSVLQELLDDSAEDGGGSGTAVVFVDLDAFKPVNDELGHAAGDDLLIRVAQQIRKAVRVGDIVGRFGGDEFVVVCPEVPSPEDALRIAQSMATRAFGTGITPIGSNREVRASFGVAWTRRGVAEAAELIRQADTAMYHSKHAGLSEPVMFDAART